MTSCRVDTLKSIVGLMLWLVTALPAQAQDEPAEAPVETLEGRVVDDTGVPVDRANQLYFQFLAFDTSTWLADDHTEGLAITIGEG